MSPEDLVPFLLVAVASSFSGGLANPREYLADTTRSQLWVVTHRSGVLSFLGHDHAIIPTDWSASLCLEEPLERGAAGAIVIRTNSLVIDSDSARAIAGLGKGPGADDVRELQQKFLDAEHLDAEHHPEIRVHLLGVDPDTDTGVTARVRLSVRGVTREFQLPVGVEHLDDGALRLTGELQIQQRDFGLDPESVAGVVKVSNDVDLHFRLVAAPTTRPCVIPA